MKKPLTHIFLTVLLAGCETNSNETHQPDSLIAVSLILDITDQRKYWPGADQILTLYHCTQTPNAECQFRLRTISDKRLTPIVSYRLPGAKELAKTNTLNDPQFRNKSIVAFYTTVRKSIGDFYSSTDTAQTLNNSECYRVIAGELTYLAENKSSERQLIIGSDLMEKSDLMDSYTSGLTNPVDIAKQLSKANLLPKILSEITVIFLFSPRDRKEDKTFSMMVEAYKILLEGRGAEVKIQANL